jgi:hypothetical protein
MIRPVHVLDANFLNIKRKKAAYSSGAEAHSICGFSGTAESRGLPKINWNPALKMTNDELIRDFEAGTPDAPSFHHADHVRLAFAYLSTYPVLEALEKFSDALKRFAASRGKPQLYHETITHAYFFLIRERMARTATSGWDDFARINSDLLLWKDGILTRYYRESTLQSDLARKVFLFPDQGL